VTESVKLKIEMQIAQISEIVISPGIGLVGPLRNSEPHVAGGWWPESSRPQQPEASGWMHQ
jgi:hypothetical protein